MSKFKVGDRVRRVGGGDSEYFDVGGIYRITSANEYGYSLEDKIGNANHGASPEWLAANFELASGPIRTVTRREIVPGVYGGVTVERIPFDGLEITYKSYGNAHKLREAAHIFNQIAEVLEE